jgi:hypothetical protein
MLGNGNVFDAPTPEPKQALLENVFVLCRRALMAALPAASAAAAFEACSRNLNVVRMLASANERIAASTTAPTVMKMSARMSDVPLSSPRRSRDSPLEGAGDILRDIMSASAGRRALP